MHRHHAHAARRLGEFALDRSPARPHLGEEALQRRRGALLVRQRQVEELGDDVVDLAAEPRRGTA